MHAPPPAGKRGPLRLILALLALTALPFVLLRDCYPLFRMGMFASPPEAAKPSAANESFLVFRTLADGSRERLPDWAAGFSKPDFDYLKRNHYYRGEALALLRKLDSLTEQPAVRWEFYRLAEGDTALIARYPPSD